MSSSGRDHRLPRIFTVAAVATAALSFGVLGGVAAYAMCKIADTGKLLDDEDWVEMEEPFPSEPPPIPLPDAALCPDGSMASMLPSAVAGFADDRPLARRRSLARSPGFSTPSERGLCWRAIARARSSVTFQAGQYLKLVEQGRQSESAHQARKDIHRTMPKHVLFRDNSEGQERLWRVLVALSMRDQEMGYTQGLNYICGVLLTQMTEEDAFWQADYFLRDCGLRSLFLPDLPLLHTMTERFEQLFQRVMPDLFEHFEKLQIESSTYTTQWFVTLFVYIFPLDLVLRVWDLFMVDGLDVFPRVGLATLYLLRDKLQGQEFESVFKVLRNPEGLEAAQLIEMARRFELLDSPDEKPEP